MSHSVSGSLTSQSGTVGEFIISPKWKGVIESSLRNGQRWADRHSTEFLQVGKVYEILTLCRLVNFDRKKCVS